MILCECGEIVDGDTFRDYIKTSFNPSTPTIGHRNCGNIFNFIDEKMPKRYSSKRELKRIALNFAKRNRLDDDAIGRLMLEVDRLKTSGNLSDVQIMVSAFRSIAVERSEF